MIDPNTSGIENPLVIDAVGIEPTTKSLVLYMFESRPWEASPARFEELRRKVNSYVFYAGGQLAEDYPAHASRPRYLELRCLHQPDAQTLEYIAALQQRLRELGLKLIVRVSATLAPPQ